MKTATALVLLLTLTLACSYSDEEIRNELETVKSELEITKGEIEKIKSGLEEARAETLTVLIEVEETKSNMQALQTSLADASEDIKEVKQVTVNNLNTVWGVYTDLQMIWWSLDDDVGGLEIGRSIGDSFDDLVMESAKCLTEGVTAVAGALPDPETFGFHRAFTLWRLLENGYYASKADFQALHEIVC